MGYERKRGKLADLNAFLRGDEGTRFTLVVGETSALDAVKYVITLDSDTQLPREAAQQLVAREQEAAANAQHGSKKNAADKASEITEAASDYQQLSRGAVTLGGPGNKDR